GDNIFLELPISFTQAALGDEVEAPTVHGNVKLKIPAGTQNGKVFRLKGKGAPNVRGYGQGDQHIQISVITPKKLTNRQKELLKEFHEISYDDDLSDKEDSFFDIFKKAFRGDKTMKWIEIIFHTHHASEAFITDIYIY